MTEWPKTGKEARTIGVDRYFTGKPCKRNHVSLRRASDGMCMTCAYETGRSWQNNNRDKVREAGKRWRIENPDKDRSLHEAWHARNPDKVQESGKKWRSKNAERLRANAKAWRVNNPGKVVAYANVRRARKLNATPAWLSTAQLAEIAEFYEQAKRKEAMTGIKHHVDHIVPLKGKKVCGLHVPWNLQVITAAENHEKNAKFKVE